MGSGLRHVLKRRVHLERSQPASREKKFGLLEKHKDYVVRAQDYNKKKKALRNLREKARLRNPDEFSFKMIKSRINEHGKYEKLAPETSLEDSLKENLGNRQLVELKRTSDIKATEKARTQLHMLSNKSRAKSHIIFNDSNDDENYSSDESDSGNIEAKIAISAIAGRSEKAVKDVAVEATIQLTEALVEEYESLAETVARTAKLTSVLDNLELQKHLSKAKKYDTTKVVDDTASGYLEQQRSDVIPSRSSDSKHSTAPADVVSKSIISLSSTSISR